MVKPQDQEPRVGEQKPLQAHVLQQGQREVDFECSEVDLLFGTFLEHHQKYTQNIGQSI